MLQFLNSVAIAKMELHISFWLFSIMSSFSIRTASRRCNLQDVWNSRILFVILKVSWIVGDHANPRGSYCNLPQIFLLLHYHSSLLSYLCWFFILVDVIVILITRAFFFRELQELLRFFLVFALLMKFGFHAGISYAY